MNRKLFVLPLLLAPLWSATVKAAAPGHVQPCYYTYWDPATGQWHTELMEPPPAGPRQFDGKAWLQFHGTSCLWWKPDFVTSISATGMDVVVSTSGSGGIPGPTITDVRLLSSELLFELNNNGQFTNALSATEWFASTSTDLGTIDFGPPDSAHLFEFELDFSDLVPWVEYTVSFSSATLGATMLYDEFGLPIELDLLDFKFMLIPEPSSIVLGLMGAGGLCCLAVRRRLQCRGGGVE